MMNIQIHINSNRAGYGASGTVRIGAVVDFRAEAKYAPTNTGPGLAYPWVVTVPTNEDALPQRFTTYDGALAEVKALTLRNFDLAVQEQSRARVSEDLKKMVEEILA